MLPFGLLPSSCGQGTTAAKVDRVAEIAPATRAATTEDEPRPESNPLCPPPLVLAPTVLASGRSSLLGRRVRLRVRPVRAISVTEWLVVAGGQRFVVVASPDTSWASEHVFLVAGASSAFVHGQVSLPELILSDECDT
jgi:hypothetical protein